MSAHVCACRGAGSAGCAPPSTGTLVDTWWPQSPESAKGTEVRSASALPPIPKEAQRFCTRAGSACPQASTAFLSHLHLCCWAIHLVLINAGRWCPGRFRPGRPAHQHRSVLADGPRGSPPPRVPCPALWNRKGAPTARRPPPPAGYAPFQSHVEASRHARGDGPRVPLVIGTLSTDR